MDLLQATLLGLIQGITEWLPISSTGHLRIAEHFFNLTVPLLFDVALHVGTLVVILFFFRSEIRDIFAAFIKLDFKSEKGKLIPLIILGTIPTALIGYFIGNFLDTVFSTLFSLGAGFIFCAVVLYSSKHSKETKENITYLEALIIGVAQGIAIIPSVTRSGMTIAAALIMGIKRETAFKFSFLLSVPSIIGALGLTLYEQHNSLMSANIGIAEIFVGITVTVVVSVFALKLLWRTLVNRKFHLFAFYCAIIGILLIGLGLAGF